VVFGVAAQPAKKRAALIMMATEDFTAGCVREEMDVAVGYMSV